MTEVARRIAKIRAYAEPVAEQAGTYADLVWLCKQLEEARVCRMCSGTNGDCLHCHGTGYDR